METTVVARAPFGVAIALLLFLLSPLIIWVVVEPSLISSAGGAIAITMVLFSAVRVRAMRLAVDDASVEVANFFTTHRLELASVQIESEETTSLWPADDIPASQTQVTVGDDAPDFGELFLSDRSGARVKVGLVPSYGQRRAEIVRDLRAAVKDHRGY